MYCKESKHLQFFPVFPKNFLQGLLKREVRTDSILTSSRLILIAFEEQIILLKAL